MLLRYARLAIMPAKAPVKITANMIMPTIIGESVIILFPEWFELHPDNVHLQSQIRRRALVGMGRFADQFWEIDLP